jgi:hypothetical protein
MKKLNYYLGIGLLSGIMLVSCDKKEDAVINDATIDDIADDIASSLGSTNSGITEEILDVAQLSGANLPANLKSTEADTLYKNDTSMSKTNMEGAIYQFSYQYQMQIGFVFEGYENYYFYYYGSANGNMESPRMSSDIERSSNLRLTGLDAASSSYVLNGTISRKAMIQSKVRNKNQLNSDADIVVSNVKVNKATLKVEQGTMSFNYTATMNQEQYTFTIIVTYMGDGIAEMAINGNTYRVNISTGEIE